MTNPICVDLSHWNPEPNWQSLKAGGTLGVILKATEGTSYVDPTFSPRRVAAQQAGLAHASYHFLKHGNVEKQMAFYVKTVNPVPGERLIIDYEDAAVTLDDLHTAVEYLVGLDANLQIAIYSGHLIKQHVGNTKDLILADTSLWLAQYSQTPSWPSGTWPTWSLWQYTDKATVAGISAPVDGNRFNGLPENFVRWLSPAGSQPMPEPVEPVVPGDLTVTVDIKVNTPPGVHVDITLNGVML